MCSVASGLKSSMTSRFLIASKINGLLFTSKMGASLNAGLDIRLTYGGTKCSLLLELVRKFLK